MHKYVNWSINQSWRQSMTERQRMDSKLDFSRSKAGGNTTDLRQVLFCNDFVFASDVTSVDPCVGADSGAKMMMVEYILHQLHHVQVTIIIKNLQKVQFHCCNELHIYKLSNFLPILIFHSKKFGIFDKSKNSWKFICISLVSLLISAKVPLNFEDIFASKVPFFVRKIKLRLFADF